jgi:transposase-like protein
MGERNQIYQLFGTIELDDTFSGGKKKGGKRGRGTKKTKVIVAVSKSEGDKPRYVKMSVVQNLKSKTIEKFVLMNIQKNSTVQTDAYHSYRNPLAKNYNHQYEVFDSDSEMLCWLHIIIGNAKAFVNGTFHGLEEKHLQRYLDEFCYRFNRRFLESNLFIHLLSTVASASPLTFADLN